MKPKFNITKEYIEITGHYDNPILCAKLTLLCQLYGADLTDGYAKLDYDEKFVEQLKLIDDTLLFSYDTFPISIYDYDTGTRLVKMTSEIGVGGWAGYLALLYGKFSIVSAQDSQKSLQIVLFIYTVDRDTHEINKKYNIGTVTVPFPFSNIKEDYVLTGNDMQSANPITCYIDGGATEQLTGGKVGGQGVTDYAHLYIKFFEGGFNIFVGNSQVTSSFVGSTNVNKIFLGSTEL